MLQEDNASNTDAQQAPLASPSEAQLRDRTSDASSSGLEHLAPPRQRSRQALDEQQHAAASGADGSSSSLQQHSSSLEDQHAQRASSARGSNADGDKEKDKLPGDKDLYLEIKACDTWQDVLDIAADEAEAMSLRTAVQALNRVGALARQRGDASVAALHPSFKALVSLLYSRVADMNPIQLCNTLVTLSQLKVEVAQPVLTSFAEVASSKAGNFWPRDISMFIYALAQLRGTPSRECLDRLCFRAVYFLSKGEFEPQGISTLMYGCVLLDYSNGLLNRAAALAATDQLQRFGAQALANTLWALAHMAFYHKPLLEGALGVVAARPGDFKPQELANIIWAITRQRHHPGAAAGPLVRSLLERPTSLSGQDIATVLYMLATFSIAPGGPILRSLLSELLARLPNMAVQQQAAAYWSLGMLREVNMPVFAALEASIDAAHAASPLDESTLRMVFQGFACSKLAGSERLPGFSPLLLDAMKRAWVGSAAISNRDSAVLDALAEVLKQLKVRHEARRPTKDGLVLIDIALKPSPERFVALQVVQAEEMATNTGQLLATAHFHKDILERNGWEVKHLPVKDLHALADPRLQPLFVAELLKSLGIKAKAIPAASLEAAKAIQAAAAAAASLAPQQRGSRSGGAAGGADVSALSDMDRLVKSQPSLPLKSRKNKSSK